MESSFNDEKKQLTQRLHETELDLIAATKARRDLQQTLKDAESHINYVTEDNDRLKVC